MKWPDLRCFGSQRWKLSLHLGQEFAHKLAEERQGGCKIGNYLNRHLGRHR